MSQAAVESKPRRHSRRRRPPVKQAPAPRFAPLEAPCPSPAVQRLVAAKKAAAAAVIGTDFVMFEEPADVAAFDFAKLDEHSRLTSFLDAIYFPQALRDPRRLISVPRTRAGNRTNVTAGIWDLSEGHDKIRRWKKWIVVRRRRDERVKINPLAVLALVSGFMILLLFGFGVHRAATARPKAPDARTYTMASTRRPPRPVDGSGRGDPVIDRAQVRLDAAGEIVEVRAADPRSVLLAFCREKRDAMCQPLELASTDPPQPLTRYGVYRSFYDLRAIRITRDAGTGAWVTAGGTKPVVDEPVENLPLSRARVPISRSPAWR